MLPPGRLSPRIVWVLTKTAGPLPPLAICRVQVQPPPSAWLPPTLSLLLIVRSGCVTVTLLLQLLLASLFSDTTLLGSTAQAPPPRGLAKTPVALGVAVNSTSNAPLPAARTT